MKKFKLMLIIISMVIVLAACKDSDNQEIDSNSNEVADSQPQNGEIIEDTDIDENETREIKNDDPEAAVEEIYSEIEINGIEIVDDQTLTEKFGVNMDYVDQYWARYSAKNYGVSDVFIVKPIDDSEDKVEEAFQNIKKIRIDEFTNYDVYGSLEIAQKSIIYTQGEYVVMLMLDDNNKGKEVIENHISE